MYTMYLSHYISVWKIPSQVQVHGIVYIANPLAQLGLINLRVIDNANDTTTFYR